MLFIAFLGDSQPHFTTLAAFVSNMGEMVAKRFAQVFLLGDRQGMIGREMFAINGVKLPANVSNAKSGTRADYQHQADKIEKAAKQRLEKNHSAACAPIDDAVTKRDAQKLVRLQPKAQ